jgi:hypothetical protein
LLAWPQSVGMMLADKPAETAARGSAYPFYGAHQSGIIGRSFASTWPSSFITSTS